MWCLQIKCHRYYPESGSQVFGMFTVSLKREECLAEYTVRHLVVEGPRDGQPLHVTQFHFTAWPDHGVPQYATGLLSFRNRVNQHHVLHKGSPMVVHCSAGVGRTGTYISVDILLKKIEAEGIVDVFNVVRQLRWHRKYMVQTVVRGRGGVDGERSVGSGGDWLQASCAVVVECCQSLRSCPPLPAVPVCVCVQCCPGGRHVRGDVCVGAGAAQEDRGAGGAS